MPPPPRFLLLQVRNPDDPMKPQEVGCFARALRCTADQLEPRDLITAPPSPRELDRADAVLLGGSGDYSVAEGGTWLEAALDAMRWLHDHAKPTFASCWGFQAFARALGGHVVTDMSRAELGTIELTLTPAGRSDPVFSILPPRFCGHAGHQDVVDRLPPDAVLLASSSRVAHQAFTFEDKPIYCTQFHPELDRASFLERLTHYPEYVVRIAGMTIEEFAPQCREAADAGQLLPAFCRAVFS